MTAFVRQHHQHGGRAVEGVPVIARDGGVEPGEGVPGGLVLHRHDDRTLRSHPGGRPGSGGQHRLQFFGADLLRQIRTAAPSFLHSL